MSDPTLDLSNEVVARGKAMYFESFHGAFRSQSDPQWEQLAERVRLRWCARADRELNPDMVEDDGEPEVAAPDRPVAPPPPVTHGRPQDPPPGNPDE